MLILSKASAREARRCRVTNQLLYDAVDRARRGKIDARLGATFIKQQVARPPEGRKTACRAIIAFKNDEDRAFVMQVYAKSAKSDLSPREREALSDLSRQLFALSDAQIETLIRDRGWKKIEHAEEGR